MSEQIEWMVGYKDGGILHTVQDGAQSVFGLTSATRLAKKLGDPYQLFHWQSNLPAAEHEVWLKAQSEGSWGGQWAP